MNNNEKPKELNEENYIECPKCERRIKEEEQECPYCQCDLVNGPKKEKEENKSLKVLKTMLKEKYIIIESSLTAFCFILIIISLVVGKNLGSKYHEANLEYINTNKALQETKTKLENANEKISKNQSEIEELKQTNKQKEINNSIATLENKVIELTNQKISLENQISELSSEVIKLKGEPKTYPAGHLTAGTDVPTGKYKIYGGNSNFVVRSSSGSLQVNIVLGTNAYSVSEYIYTFKTGDKIEARSTFKLIEVE